MLLARVGRNRFPEASAHYRPAGLAITCEASFDFVCASAVSDSTRERPSEIRLDGSSKSRKKKEPRGSLAVVVVVVVVWLFVWHKTVYARDKYNIRKERSEGERKREGKDAEISLY